MYVRTPPSIGCFLVGWLFADDIAAHYGAAAVDNDHDNGLLCILSGCCQDWWCFGIVFVVFKLK